MCHWGHVKARLVVRVVAGYGRWTNSEVKHSQWVVLAAWNRRVTPGAVDRVLIVTWYIILQGKVQVFRWWRLVWRACRSMSQWCMTFFYVYCEKKSTCLFYCLFVSRVFLVALTTHGIVCCVTSCAESSGRTSQSWVGLSVVGHAGGGCTEFGLVLWPSLNPLTPGINFWTILCVWHWWWWHASSTPGINSNRTW